MTPAEIQEAAKILSSLDGLRRAVSELDFPYEQIAARSMSISFCVRGRWSGRAAPCYTSDLVKRDDIRDDEMVAAVLAITRRRRQERLAAALRRLAQLGVTP